jgi:DNA-binding IclR family transcriptional regulator
MMGGQAMVGTAGDPPARAEVPAVAAAIRILRHLAVAPAPLGVTPLARALGLNTSTCFNILRTLAQGELVRFDADAKTYALDLGLVDLARAAFARGAEIAQAQPMMRQLALRHGVTVTLWRPAGPDRMVLTQVA